MMIEFLRFVFVLLLVWYGTKLIIKYVVPWLLMRFLNKQKENFDKYSKPDQNYKEGEVNIKDEKNKAKKKDDTQFGEYVDFEEVEPDQDTTDG